MANKRIHDLDDIATTLDSGAYIAVDSDSYTAAKKFAADSLPDPTGATDGYVWTADGANGAAWEAVSGGASDVTDLTTTTGSSTNMVRVAAAGGLEYRTAAQVLSDIGALAATGSVTGATSSAQTFTNGVVTGAIKPASDSTTALQLQNSSGTAVVTIDTTNKHLGLGTTPSKAVDFVAREMLVGATASGDRADATNKNLYILCPHKTNSEVPMLLLLATSSGVTASGASVSYGGGSGAYNAAGELRFYAAADSATRTGTKMLQITTSGAEFLAGKITAAAATTSYASLNVPSGTAPTSPADGDIWFNGTALHVRVSGTTYTLDMTAA